MRIKIAQALYAYFKDPDGSMKKAESELFHSIRKSYDLFYYVLLLLINMKEYASEKIEIARDKKRPSYEDLHPNTRFIAHQVINALAENEGFQDYIKKHKISWVNYPGFIRKFYEKVVSSTYFKEYMEKMEVSQQDDKKLLVKILTKDLIFHEDFYDVLEEQSIYWNDEVDFIISIVGSLIKKINPRSGYVPLPPVYKNEEDEEYAKILFRKTIIHFDEHKKYIDMFTTNWDVDRIAFFDNLIMAQAITEMIEFPSIPVKVTFNEYLEVAKYYSTRNSSNFINGVLDKILHKLRDENKVQKSGRGLIE